MQITPTIRLMGYLEYEVRLGQGFLCLSKRKTVYRPLLCTRQEMFVCKDFSQKTCPRLLFGPRNQSSNLADPAMTQIWEDMARQ